MTLHAQLESTHELFDPPVNVYGVPRAHRPNLDFSLFATSNSLYFLGPRYGSGAVPLPLPEPLRKGEEFLGVDVAHCPLCSHATIASLVVGPTPPKSSGHNPTADTFSGSFPPASGDTHSSAPSNPSGGGLVSSVAREEGLAAPAVLDSSAAASTATTSGGNGSGSGSVGGNGTAEAGGAGAPAAGGVSGGSRSKAAPTSSCTLTSVSTPTTTTTTTTTSAGSDGATPARSANIAGRSGDLGENGGEETMGMQFRIALYQFAEDTFEMRTLGSLSLPSSPLVIQHVPQIPSEMCTHRAVFMIGMFSGATLACEVTDTLHNVIPAPENSPETKHGNQCCRLVPIAHVRRLDRLVLSDVDPSPPGYVQPIRSLPLAVTAVAFMARVLPACVFSRENDDDKDLGKIIDTCDVKLAVCGYQNGLVRLSFFGNITHRVSDRHRNVVLLPEAWRLESVRDRKSPQNGSLSGPLADDCQTHTELAGLDGPVTQLKLFSLPTSLIPANTVFSTLSSNQDAYPGVPSASPVPPNQGDSLVAPSKSPVLTNQGDSLVAPSESPVLPSEGDALVAPSESPVLPSEGDALVAPSES
eukprot:Rmarinus@m.20289